jgi:PncC family amidohydrolase
VELAERLIERLSRQQRSIAVAESLTGGLLALRLTEAPGSGEVFRGGIVAYMTGVKHDLLEVPAGPVVTKRCASAMAAGVASLFDADIGLSTTGVAGPEGLEGHPPGNVFIACWTRGHAEVEELHLSPTMTPESIRRASVDRMLDLALASLGRSGSRPVTSRSEGIITTTEEVTRR